jgi:hypothetical protein
VSAGGNEFKVAKFLGHRTAVAARHYVHLATQAESTRAFVEERAKRLAALAGGPPAASATAAAQSASASEGARKRGGRKRAGSEA